MGARYPYLEFKLWHKQCYKWKIYELFKKSVEIFETVVQKQNRATTIINHIEIETVLR